MRIAKATREYEQWLARYTAVVEADLTLKHAQMKRDVFSFLRATYYRWVQVWPEVCAELTDAPVVLAVGDLHVSNFGTWRDLEGRLIWGINDFDEAYPRPYTHDLVRLAASARVAIENRFLPIKPKEACEVILGGYSDGLEAGGRPFVLSQHHPWLRALATNQLRDPVRFWQKLNALPPVQGAVPVSARRAIEELMPARGLVCRLKRRVSGLGSLGRPRFVALAKWHGGHVAREAKALVPSASVWARDGTGPATVLCQAIIDQAIRCRDPFVRVHGWWLVRRLSPYCSRIDLVSLPRQRDAMRLLYAMGWETANVHLGSKKVVEAVRRDLAKRQTAWLRSASTAMVKATYRDWEDWTCE